jgi:signal transduction histidine kinase
VTWQHTVLLYPTLFATVVAAILGAYSLGYARRNGWTPTLAVFLVVTVALVLWTGFSALKLSRTDPAVKLTAYRALYLGASVLGPLALLFALAYTDREQWLRAPVVGALLVVPVVFWVLLFTNPAGLAIDATRLVETNGLTVLRVDVGPAHLALQFGYNALLALVAVGVIGHEAVRLGRSYLPQAVLIAVGITAPILFVLLSAADVPPFDPDGVNLIPTSAAVTSAALGVALFRYRLLELPPLAYSTAMEESPDGVLVLGRDRRVVHANEAGARLLARRGATTGERLGTAFPEIDPTTPRNDEVHLDSGDGPPTFLSVRAQQLEQRGFGVGWVLVLREITELHRQKRTIEEQYETLKLLNQIVRHDIRNDMAVVLGNARLAGEMSDDGAVQERLDTITTSGEHAVELTETARSLMTTMLEEGETTRPVRLDAALRPELDAVRTSEGRVVVEVPNDIPGTQVVADDMLGTVFGNLLTNAVRHSDVDVPTVTVRTVETDDDVEVRIADDGPGIPDDRKEAVFGRGEKGLESPGTGIGLYLVDTLVDRYGGDVWVEDNDANGAVFVVRLPKA